MRRPIQITESALFIDYVALTHRKLESFRVNNKEFFQVSVEKAIQTLRQITNMPPLFSKIPEDGVRINNSYFTKSEIAKSPMLQWMQKNQT